MNGPQHYAEAEKYVRWADELHAVNDPAGAQSAATIAQAHATLALVAARVDAAELDIADEYGTEVVTDWGRAVGES